MEPQNEIREELERIVEDPTFICSLDNPTRNEVQLAVDIALQLSAEERMSLLMKDPRFIKYILNPTIEEQKCVIYYLKDWHKYLTNPSEELKDYRIEAWLQHHPMVII